MDLEGLKSLLWIVVWGALFFVMMRYGCGAHIGGHRHGGRGERESGSGATAKDPVCGMSVDPQEAKAASVHRGTTYYFCSASCRDKLSRDQLMVLAKGREADPADRTIDIQVSRLRHRLGDDPADPARGALGADGPSRR